MTQIRPYRAADLETCRSLWVELTEHHRRIYDAPTIGGTDPGSHFDEHLAAVGPERLWVADEAELVVGLAGIIVDGASGEVEPVVVTETRRGNGIGRSLVKHVVGVARGLGIRQLSVRPVARNSHALRFFCDAGFGVLGHMEVFMDLAGDREWAKGETLAGRHFKV